MNYLLLALGLLIHISMKIGKVAMKEKENFNLIHWVRTNMWYLITSTLSAVSILLILTIPEQINVSFGIMEVDVMKLGCLLAGYGNGSLFKNLVDTFQKKKK